MKQPCVICLLKVGLGPHPISRIIPLHHSSIERIRDRFNLGQFRRTPRWHRPSAGELLKPCARCLFKVGFGTRAITRLTGIGRTTLKRMRLRIGVAANQRAGVSLKNIVRAEIRKRKPKPEPTPKQEPALWDFSWPKADGWEPLKPVEGEGGQFEMFGECSTPTGAAEQEMWKPIPGFRKYECSTLGRIRNWETGTILKLRICKDGYRMVGLSESGRQFTLLVHRVVALTFLANTNALPTVNHKNRIKHDNRLSNLEWSSHSSQAKHAWKTRHLIQ